MLLRRNKLYSRERQSLLHYCREVHGAAAKAVVSVVSMIVSYAI